MNGSNHSGISHCRDCGKLISAGLPDGRCSVCRGAEAMREKHDSAKVTQVRKTLEQLADTVGVSSHEVRQAMRDLPTLARYLDNEPTCANCGRRPPIEGMQLCLRCQVDALYVLRNATDEAYERALEMQDGAEMQRNRSVLDMVDEKRARTSTANINPSGAQKVKNYRFT